MGFEVTYVPQPDWYSCNHACLAMIAQIPIEEAVSAMGKRQGPGSSAFYRALKKYRIDHMSWRSVENVDVLPPICVLLIAFPTYTHTVLYYEGIYYDPEYGVLEAYTPGGRITHYLEVFIPEVYEGRSIPLKVPTDFQEAFANDPEAHAIFNRLSYPERAKCVNKIGQFKNQQVRQHNIRKIVAELKKLSQEEKI
jgi:hypothetical protein